MRLKALLVCGILSPLCYVVADIIASLLYPGYSYADQAVSELFAVGAPTSELVVDSFTVSSLLIAAFGVGVWASSQQSRARRLMALMMWANGADSLILWNFFPMHMRGVTRTFTDTMHAVLAINPFVLMTLILGLIAFKDWFRIYTAATIAVVLILATSAFGYIPELQANQPTHGLGLAERAGQYAHQLWHAVLAIVLLRHQFASLEHSRYGAT